MWIKGLMRYITESSHSPILRVVMLTAYYVAIIAALIVMYGPGSSTATEFVYQGF
jgi:uncharacterized membrane protein YbhN (UPF0104 family)